jgi:CDP-diacylglycerol--serine O-phosphatidyltransferase
MIAAASPLRCFHPSNLLTYASLLASIASIACAGLALPGVAGALIALAVILDTFDGRFARMFVRSGDQRAIGGQLDSLADAVSFGLAPAMCMVMLRWRPASAGLSLLELLWWTSVFLFVACAISRLAFYNVTREQTDGFIGLPAPVAALVWATVLLLNPGVAASAVVFAATAVAMVLPLPIPRPRGVAFAAFVAWPLIVIALHVV